MGLSQDLFREPGKLGNSGLSWGGGEWGSSLVMHPASLHRPTGCGVLRSHLWVRPGDLCWFCACFYFPPFPGPNCMGASGREVALLLNVRGGGGPRAGQAPLTFEAGTTTTRPRARLRPAPAPAPASVPAPAPARRR